MAVMNHPFLQGGPAPAPVGGTELELPRFIPGKGIVLTALSAFWLGRTGDIVENQLLTTDVATALPDLARAHPELEGRSMVVRKTQRVDIECVVRGYLAGSGWSEYRKSGTLAGE